MNSVTKRYLSKSTIEMLYNRAFGKNTQIEEIIELKDGYFNNSYCIRQSDGQQIVLKIAPRVDAKMLRYEKNLMKAEASVLEQVSKLEIKSVPRVLYYDDTHDVIDGDYLFMEYKEGVTLYKVRSLLSDEMANSISLELGNTMRVISNIRGEYFGFINIENRRYKSWYDCFLIMISDLIDDAIEENIHLPINKEEATLIVKKFKPILDTVSEPVLIHKDLWDRNIIVNPESYEITGIIDFERALYGDKLLEISCGFLDENELFVNRYLEKMILDQNEKIRIELYKYYLYLIMVIECPYREYEDHSQETWAREKLDVTIKKIQEL